MKEYIERRTFIDDRFDILIKKQREGTASFNELTELDNLVNRYPEFRKIILDEMTDTDQNSGDQQVIEAVTPQKPGGTLLDTLRSFFSRLFASRAELALQPIARRASSF